MESYVKVNIPQIIFGSKSAQKVSGLLKKYIQVVHQWQVRLMHILIREWFFISFLLPNNQCGAYSLRIGKN